MATASSNPVPGCGSRSMRSSSGWSVSRAPHGPGMKRDSPEIGGPHDVRSTSHSKDVGLATRRERDLAGFDVLGPFCRQPLLVNLFALDAVGESLKMRGPILERPQRCTLQRHRSVVLDKMPFGSAVLTQLRIVDLVRARQSDRDPVDVQFLCRARHHLPPARTSAKSYRTGTSN